MFCSFTCRRVTNKVLLRSSRQRKGRHQVLLRRGFLRALPFLRWYPLNICCSPVTQTSPKTFDESVSLCSSWGMGLAKFFSLQERDLITSIYCKGNCASLSLILKTIFVGVDGLEGSGNKLRTALHNPDGLSCEGPTFCSSVLKWQGTQVKDPLTFLLRNSR